MCHVCFLFGVLCRGHIEKVMDILTSNKHMFQNYVSDVIYSYDTLSPSSHQADFFFTYFFVGHFTRKLCFTCRQHFPTNVDYATIYQHFCTIYFYNALLYFHIYFFKPPQKVRKEKVCLVKLNDHALKKVTYASVEQKNIFSKTLKK